MSKSFNIKIVLLVVFLILSCSSFSQTFKGTVTENKEPIIGAIVKIKDQSNQKTLKYDVTNSEGQFSIESLAYGQYTLEISHILYNNLNEILDFSYGDNTYSYTLVKEDNIIDDVIVSAKGNSLIRRGDTIIIQPSYYLTGYERDLKDVLEELPGFSIIENQVFYQGKVVNTILLQEKELYGYNNSIILESLIPKDIETIQIIENYKTKSEQIASTDSEKIALNVELKKEALKLRGKLNVGFGDKGYETNNSLYDVSYGGGFTAFAKSNNLGNNVLSVGDVANLSSNMQDFTNAFINNDLPRSLIDKNSSQGIGYSLGGSMINEFSKKTKLTTTLLNSFGDRDQNYNIERVDLLNNGIINFEEVQTNKSALTSLKNKFELQLNPQTLLESEVNMNYTKGSQNTDFSQRNSVFDDRMLSINPSFTLSHGTKDSSWTFLLQSKTGFDFIRQDIILLDQDAVFTETIGDNIFSLSQNLNIEKQKFNNEFVVTPLKNDLLVNLTLKQQSDTFDFKTQPNQGTPQEFAFDDLIHSQNFSLKPKFSVTKGKFQIKSTPSITSKKINRNNVSESFFVLEGEHRITLNINPNFRFWAGYINENNYLHPTQFQEQLRLKTITDINNGPLDFKTRRQDKSLFFGFFRSKPNYLDYTQLYYSYNIGENTPYQDIRLFDNYVYSFYRLAYRKTSHSLSSNISKEIMTKGGRSYLRSKFLIGQTDLENQQGETQDVGSFSISSKFNYKANNWLLITPEVDFNYSNGESFTNERIDFTNLRSSLTSRLFWGDFSVENKFEFSRNTRNEVSFSANPILNTGVEYQGVDKLIIYIKGEDLFNLNGMENQRFNYFDTFYEISTFNQRPGYILVGLEWKL